MNSIIKKIINLIVLLLIFDVVCFFKIIRAEEANKPSIIMKYQDGMLNANIKEARLMEIFEEIKKNTGINYIMEKEMRNKVITISIIKKEIEQGIKDILDEIGDVSYMLVYDNNKKGSSNIVNIFIGIQTKVSKDDYVIGELIERLNVIEQNSKKLEKEFVESKNAAKNKTIVKQETHKEKTKETLEKKEEEAGTIKEGTILSHTEVIIKTVTIDYFMRKKSAVILDHLKHSETLKIKCEDCHHKKADRERDEQTKCSNKNCHAKVQKKNGKIYDARKSSAELNPYHVVCVNCHKKYKNDDKKEAPTKCKDCHIKEKSNKRN